MKRFLKCLAHNERGLIGIGGILMMGISMVFLAVGFIMYPIAIDGTDAILAYTYSGNVNIMTANFTGLTAIAGITPLLILLGFISAAVITGFLGFKVMKSGAGAKMSPGNMIMLGLSIVFIALGLIIFPVVLDGISLVWDGGDHHGLSASYTGLRQILLITPMLVLLAFIAASVISGFFGVKNLASGMD